MITNLTFITAHPNPASHFVEYVRSCEDAGVECQVIAGNAVSGKFATLGKRVIEIDLDRPDLLEALNSQLASQSVVITDLATEKWAELFEQLEAKHPDIRRVVYYDNPEAEVPGFYSKVAARVIPTAHTVLFANRSLVEKGVRDGEGNQIDLSGKTLFGIGYYPKEEANKIAKARADRASVEHIRRRLFERNGIPNEPKKRVLVYAGGANEDYYTHAFPHFMKLIAELAKQSDSPLQDTVLVLQQHPRAPKEGDKDANEVKRFLTSTELPKGFHVIISDLKTPEALAIADGVLYYQTSMAAQFIFAGIPTVVQVGHDEYQDVATRSGVPKVATSGELSHALSPETPAPSSRSLEEDLGIDSSWRESFIRAIRSQLDEPPQI